MALTTALFKSCKTLLVIMCTFYSKTILGMANQIQRRTKQLSVVEPSTLFRKIISKIKNDWDEIELANNWNSVTWAQKRLLVNHEYRFIYCAIPKNASSSLMKAIVRIGNSKRKEKLLNSSRDTIRNYVELNYSLASYTYAEANKIINSDYFKFVIVRNPWARLVSTYLNLFVRFHEHGRPTDLVRDSVKYISGEDLKDRDLINITFEQLIDYLCATEDRYLDQHCIPQYLFLGGVNNYFLARMENLSKDLQYIEKNLNLSLELPNLNKTEYSYSSNGQQNFEKISASDIRNWKTTLPDYKQFYTPELIYLVSQRYAQDIEMFGYKFAEYDKYTSNYLTIGNSK
ncbi:MAG: sulfotransferase family protein [Cyanobacteria bacterium P01_A01_bin.68]